MKYLKEFKLFEASQENVEYIFEDFKDKVRSYLQDEFDSIDFEVKLHRGSSMFQSEHEYMISLWISSDTRTEHGHLKAFSVKDVLPILENLNSFMESNGFGLYHLISDTPNKPSNSRSKLKFKYDDVTKIYMIWK